MDDQRHFKMQLRHGKYAKRVAILSRLASHGALPVMVAGGLLQGNYIVIGNQVQAVPLYGTPRDPWDIYDASSLVSSLSGREKMYLRKIGPKHFDRLNKAFRGFGNTILLSVKNLNSIETYKGIYDLKVWFLKVGLDNEDLAIGYLKKISDLCLALAFGTPKEIDWTHGIYPNYPDRKDPLPFFRGELGWIRERAQLFFKENNELPQLTFNEYFMLSQICVSKRSLPFPSEAQVQDAVSEVTALLQIPKKVSKEAIDGYKYSLRRLKPFLSTKYNTRPHISVSSSACFENSRSDGGRGSYFASILAKPYEFKVPYDQRCDFWELTDFLGREVLAAPDPEVNWVMNDFANLDPFGNLPYGYVFDESNSSYAYELFFKPSVKLVGLERQVMGESKLTENSGDFILACMATEMLRYGHFDVDPVRLDPFPMWKKGTNPIYFLDRNIPSKASLSIESGLKARMVTCQPAWFTELFQPMRHAIVEVLTNDKTLQIGLEENYKLWEFFKRIPKGEKFQRIFSLDLKEATYNISFDILRANFDLFEQITPSSRLWRAIRMINVRPQRELMWNHEVIKDFDLKVDVFESEVGSFMGEPLSFMHLTLLLRLMSIIAEAYAEYEKFEKLLFPAKFEQVLNYGFPKILSEHAGDDMIALCSESYCRHFDHLIVIFGLVKSKGKHGESPYFGVFCENFVCLPKDPESIPANCRFGDYAYLDIVKGRLINSFSKVAGSEQSPVLGQGSSLATALEWWSGDSKLAQTLFWVANFSSLRKTHNMNLHLPPVFGGFSLPFAKGPYTYGSDEFTDTCISYLYAIYKLKDDKKFLLYSFLIRSIRISTAKDIVLEEKMHSQLPDILKSLKVYTRDEVKIESIPGEGYTALISRIKDLGYRPWSDLENIVGRLNAFSILLNGSVNRKVRDLSLQNLRRKFKVVWEKIYKEIDPIKPEFTDFKKFTKEYILREGNFFYKEDDIPALLKSTSLSLHKMVDPSYV